MMGRRVVLREVVSTVAFAGAPVDNELALADAVTDPIEAHIHCFGAFLFDSVINNTSSSAVVSLNGCGRLRMAKFNECMPEGARIFAVVKEGSKFGFSSTGDNFLQDLAVDVDRAIGCRRGSTGVRWSGGVTGFVT